jgi:high-affinity K+ transport system ATPase subunit B
MHQVRRGGHVREASVHDIVVGDVVVVEAGDKVAADGVLLEYYDVTANESSLTGALGDWLIIAWGFAFADPSPPISQQARRRR